MGQMISSSFPPKAKFTEHNVGDQSGKIFIVTGSTSGVGEALAGILYQNHGKVYLAARSEDKATKTISALKSRHPNSKGALIFLHLDLNDLTTIKKSASAFLAQESHLDVLWLNAGVMMPPQGSKTAQNYELQHGTNVLAHFLFTKLLTPILVKTAAERPKGTVRVVWVSSSAAMMAPKQPVAWENMNYEKKDESSWVKYARSKAGNVIHGAEFARRVKDAGVVSISLNPGNLKTELQRHVSVPGMLFNWLLYTPIHGAYTELYAGLSPDITMEYTGGWVSPWGRQEKIRQDLFESGLGAKFWEYSEEQVRQYE